MTSTQVEQRGPMRTNGTVAIVFCQWPDGVPPFSPIWNVPLTTPILARTVERRGWNVRLIDTRLFPSAIERSAALLAPDVAAAIVATEPAVVAFSFLSPSAELARAIAGKVRESSPGTPLLAGGTHCTVAPDLFTDRYDLIVRGEGEEVFPECVERLASGERPIGAARTVRAGPVNLGAAETVVGADWAPYDHVQQQIIPPPKAAFLELGRGCPFQCTFCEVANKDNFSAKRRARNPDAVVAAATRWRNEFGSRLFLVIDSIATTAPGFRETFAALCRALDSPDIGIILNSSMPVFDEAAARTIAAHCGPVTVFFGMETASERLGKRILGSKFQKGAINRSLDLCEKYGIDVGLNVIFGFADETDEDRRQTLDVLERRKVLVPNPNILTPLPGTPLYHEYLERGLLRNPLDLSIWGDDKIKSEGRGPVLRVDYAAVLDAFATARALGGGPRRWAPWQSTPTGTAD